MEWKELESDLKIGRLTDAFRHLDCLSTIYGMANFAQGARIYALRSCVASVSAHVRSDGREVGGLLLGHAYQTFPEARNPGDTLIILTRSVPSAEYRNSSVSLYMGPEIWNRIDEHILAGNILVGWYHSHPHLGAFFSGTDRSTQRGFFNQHYSLGWVIDPFDDDQKLFVGPESEEYQYPLLVVDDGLEMAQSN